MAQDWNEASNILNQYADNQYGAGKSNIDWGKAQQAFEQQQASGQGNFGDWVNNVYANQSGSWGPQAQAAPAQNPNRTYDYEKFRSDWLSGGFNTPVSGGITALQKFIAENPYAAGVTLRNEKAYDPQGRFIADMIGDVGGKNSRIFLRGSANNAPKPGTKGPISPPGPSNLPPGSGAPGGGAPGSASGNGYVNDPAWDSLYNQLLQRSQQTLNVDRNDPIIRAQADAFSANQERARRNDIANLAERSGPNANLRGEQRMAAERSGIASGEFEAQLMQRELDARRGEIQNALTQRQGMLTADQQMGLQKELALIDDATRRLQIGNQNKQFYADLGYKNKALAQSGSQFNRDLDYRYAGLNQADQQFRDQLGFNYSDRSNYWDALNRGIIG